MSVLVYGATGRTGQAVARELTKAGQTVIVAGRDQGRLLPVADDLGTEARVAGLHEVGGVLSPEIEAIMNVAGPFSGTVAPVASAAVAAGIHYVDLANELPATEALKAMSQQFSELGRTAVSAAGFGTVATDALAQALVNSVPDVVSLELSMLIDADGQSEGAAQSAAGVLRSTAMKLADGHLVPVPARERVRKQANARGHSVVALTLADLLVTPQTTGVQTVSVGAVIPAPAPLLRLLLPLIARSGSRGSRKRRPGAHGEHHSSRAWARGLRAGGEVVSAELVAGDGYDFSARAAAATVVGLVEGRGRPGFATAVGLFGPALAATAGGHITIETGAFDASAQ